MEAVTLEQVGAARERIAGVAVRTPLVRLHADDAPAEIHLKLESLQPIGSFKLRGAANAVLATDPERVAAGLWTASAGNMSQGVAWCARMLGVPCAVVVPEGAPQTKLAATRRLGAEITEVSPAEWFEVFTSRRFEGMDGLFVHAFEDPEVMAGNGTIALELLEDLPDLDAVVVPFGGGGLACGIAAALKALRPEAKVYATEIETGAPLAASLEAGAPLVVEHRSSFVDGIGSPTVLPAMLELARELIDGVVVVSLDDAAAGVRALAERAHVIAEGAAGTAAAAALAGRAGTGKVVSIVSGGNIDAARLCTILAGSTP